MEAVCSSETFVFTVELRFSGLIGDSSCPDSKKKIGLLGMRNTRSKIKKLKYIK
jgi:hypothetical protein